MIDARKLEFEFKKYMDIYKADPELNDLMKQMTFQELFNKEFMKQNSKFTSLDDMLFKSGLGLTSPADIERVNQDKWNAFIARNTECENWHQFGKLAMIEWMKTVIDLWAKVKDKRAGKTVNYSYDDNSNGNTNSNQINNATTSTVVNNQQTNTTINAANYGLQDKYIQAQNSKLLFDQAVELKRKGQYTAALMLYKQAYNVFPDDPDVQSTMYAMAKLYLLLGDYEKACTLFQDGLTQKLARHDEHTARFYKKYMESQCYGGMSESDPDFSWFQQLTADYSIFIGLSHYLLENNGAELLSRYRNDFNNHIMSVAGKTAAPPSRGYLRTCYDYGWIRVLAIASESYNRCFDKIDFGHVQKRKQEFLDILETI